MTFDFIGFSLYSKLADVVFERKKKKKNRRLLCAAENSVTVDWWWLETTTGAHVYPSDRVSISPKRQPLNDEINEVIGRRMQNMTQASERASSACMCMARCKKDIYEAPQSKGPPGTRRSRWLMPPPLRRRPAVREFIGLFSLFLSSHFLPLPIQGGSDARNASGNSNTDT